ncbi:transposase [Bacteroides fragilis]
MVIYNKSIEPARKKAKIRFTNDLECHFYLVKTGCQWHMLPLDLPKWQLVYYYYRKWATLLDFDLLLEKLPKDLFSLRK